jgi:hypothetical protein
MTSTSSCFSFKPCSNSLFRRLIPTTHFGKELHRAELVWEFDLATLRIVGLRQAVIGGYFADGGSLPDIELPPLATIACLVQCNVEL